MNQTKGYSSVEQEVLQLKKQAEQAKRKSEKNRILKRLKAVMKENDMLRQPFRKDTPVEPKGNVAEITERKCHANIQPRIKVGKRYIIESRDTMKDGTRVLVLLDGNKTIGNGKPKTMRCNEKRFSWRIVTEEEIREEAIRKEAHETTEELLNMFTFEEHMEIVFVPLIIIECAWAYAEKTLQESAKHKIDATKKLGRAVKMLRDEYYSDMAKDLDYKHRAQVQEQGQRFMQECARDFLITSFTIRNELFKAYPDLEYVDMRVYAYIALLLCDYYKQQQQKCDKFIEERTKRHTAPTIANPKIDALRTCMDAYMGTIEFPKKGNIDICVRIFENNLKKIDFTLEHEQRINKGK